MVNTLDAPFRLHAKKAGLKKLVSVHLCTKYNFLAGSCQVVLENLYGH